MSGRAGSGSPPAPLRVITGLGPNLRSFRWAVGHLRATRRRLPIEGAAVRVPLAVGMGPRGWWGVRVAVGVTRASCLERALVVQAWVGGYADPPDVVVGVKNDSGFRAHAWIDGPDARYDPAYREIARLSHDA